MITYTALEYSLSIAGMLSKVEQQELARMIDAVKEKDVNKVVTAKTVSQMVSIVTNGKIK